MESVYGGPIGVLGDYADLRIRASMLESMVALEQMAQ